MWLFVGLGNPGDKYAKNRHNVGFMAVDGIAGEYAFSPFRSKFQGLLSEGTIEGQKVAVLKPQTYMNESGRSIAAAAKFFKIAPERVVVFYDELDIEPGKLKVRQGGGAAGHNGIKSAMAHLPSPDFWRVRIGIGHPGDKNRVSGYVLSDFAKADQEWLERMLPGIAKFCGLLVNENSDDFMTRIAEEMK
ncbi:MAG: aminoacyl-tRNA hydrolase [Alphaproteobacteria bacterium]|nr:aminoacyl-tRNA hydrolase [Alphaproteobacteria bacterium]